MLSVRKHESKNVNILTKWCVLLFIHQCSCFIAFPPISPPLSLSLAVTLLTIPPEITKTLNVIYQERFD